MGCCFVMKHKVVMIRDTQLDPSSGFPGVTVVKNKPANAGDMGLIPGLERSPGEENGNPL